MQTEKPKPGMRVAALERAMATAKEAGAPEDALVAMGRELDALRAEAANSRPLGARLDSAKAKLAKAEAKVLSAEAHLEQAMKHAEETRALRTAAQEALAELQAEVPQERPNAPEELLRCTKDLLQRLESGRFAAAADIPADLIDAMTAVHNVIGAIEPPHIADLNGPLDAPEPEAAEEEEGSRCRKAADIAGEEASPDHVMQSLDGADDTDDEALLEIARRLKRLRRK